MKLLIPLSVALISATALVTANPTARDATICPGQVLVSESYIGEEKDVKLQTFTCPYVTTTESPPAPVQRDLEARQTNVCGRPCTTYCHNPSGGGPNPNDCKVIANALLYESQHDGPIFEIGTGTNNTVAMTYSSCLSFYVNQDPFPQYYCRNDWAGVIGWVAPNCQSTQNAHGGICVATDQQFFIEVVHS